MNRAVRDCLVLGYEPLIEVLELPDPDDRHVLAAAIKAHAQLIVTRNLRDFPEATLRPWNVRARHPDDFILDQLDLGRDVVENALQQISGSRNNPPQTIADVLDELERDGLVHAVKELRSYQGPRSSKHSQMLNSG